METRPALSPGLRKATAVLFGLTLLALLIVAFAKEIITLSRY